MPGDVIACGVPRSGSTLVWQVLLRSVTGRRVIKAHPASWAPKQSSFIVGSVRHPYDTVASCYRTHVVTDPGDGSPETVRGTRGGLLYVLRMIRSNFQVLQDLVEQFGSNIVVLRYEDFWADFGVIFSVVEQLGIPVPHRLRQRIQRECSFEANRARSLKDIRGTPEFQRTRVGPSHTAIGVPGSWKAVIPFWGYDLMRKWCDPLCKDWGYES